MDKEYQNVNSTIDTTNNNDANKPEHIITAKVSIDVTGEDEPTKYDKRRGRWAVVALCSFVALILSALFLFFVELNAYAFLAFLISFAVFVYSFICAGDIDPEEPTGTMPWWYGGL